MKKLFYIIPLTIHFAFLGQNIFRSFVKIDKLNKMIVQKEQNKKKLENLIKIYNKKIDNMKDMFYRETIARNELQLILPGEQIYRLINDK